MSQPPLHSAGARDFFVYWDRLPKVNLLPDRSAFDPAAILPLMPMITLLEIFSAERIDLRLAGTGVCEALGFDPTGKNYLDMQAPGARAHYLRLIEAQTCFPCGRKNILRMRHADGVVTRVEAVTLPMRHAASGRHMILSYFGTIDIVGFDDGCYQVLDFEDTQWIDIGAGIPGWN